MSRNTQTKLQISFTLSDLFWAAVLAAIVGLSAAVASAQTCTPPLFQGYPSSCSTINLRWLNRDPISTIRRFEIYRGSQKVGEVPGNAISFSELVGCGFGSTYTIRQVMNSGATCQVVTTGNPPHTKPCDLCGNAAGSATTIVSSANFRQGVSRNSLASIFPDPGVTFTDQSQFASSLPLPTSLAGVTVEIEGQLCGLVAVTPGQINFHLPAWLDSGPSEATAIIRTTRGATSQFVGRPQLNPSAPGIFTLAANGEGIAAYNWLIIKPNGQQIWQNAGALSFNSADLILLVLYGTGINEQEATLFINGRSFASRYCGDSWMAGVQQIVFEIPQSQLWPGQMGAFVRVGKAGFSFDSQGFELKR